MLSLTLAALGLLPQEAAPPPGASATDWRAVGGDRGGRRYSTLDQIHRDNVSGLETAWVHHTGELRPDGGGRTIECTPLVVDGRLYLTTGEARVQALDAASGALLWTYDPGLRRSGRPVASGGVNRGAAYWSDGLEDGQRRILHGTSDGRLHSIDARTGQLDPAFGTDGVKDLREDLEGDFSRMPYGPTSAPAICGDRVVLGFSCGEGPDRAAPGDVRAFDVRSGRQLWSFRTVPGPGEFGNDSWQEEGWRERGGANAWGGVTVDEDRGWVFVGLGSAAFDFYGGDRPGSNLFANCTLALDARDGSRRWHFQTLHHDLWDHDVPTAPCLVDVQHDGRRVEAVAQVTKTGHVFLFDRESGRPLFDVVEVPAPASTIPGEHAWPTQPVPLRPPPIARTVFMKEDATRRSPEAHADVLRQLEGLRHGQPFLPPSREGTVCTPGFHGGATWSGASFDPTTQRLYVNTNDVPSILRLIPAREGAAWPWVLDGYHRFVDHEGFPAIDPPWGRLVCVDLEVGEIAWQVPLGEHPGLADQGLPPTGTENFGGTIVTAGGLVFIGGSKDEKFRAFDAADGRVLWETSLPAGGYATPCTYAVDGRQYVCIAAGGAGKLRTRAGDAFVAFALPERER